jgi:cytochrome c biogenesis protein CcdA
MLQGTDVYAMMVVYDAGFIAVFSVFVLLYHRAWLKREELALNAHERFDTIQRLGANACFVGVGLLSLATVLIGGPRAAA